MTDSDKLKAALDADAEKRSMNYQQITFKYFYKFGSQVLEPMDCAAIESRGYERGSAPYREMIVMLAEALEMATDLLPVPECHQDDEWFAKEQRVHETLKKFYAELGMK
jgi:hypothetical protein